MTLSEVIDAYVLLQQSQGRRFESARTLLRQFSREMGNPRIGEVDAGRVAAFLRGSGALSATWTLKYRVLSGFYRFAISRGHVDSCPLPTSQPKLPPQQSPYIYSTDELRRLLDAAAALCVTNRRLRAMYRTLIMLLYGAGLRVGEALSLTLSRRRPGRPDHHRPQHQVFQNAVGADRTKPHARVDRTCPAPTAASVARR